MDLAAFAHTVLVRYLDCNDTYAAARETGRPSDMIPGVLAVADGCRADGRSVITAITAAYRVFSRLADEVRIGDPETGTRADAGRALRQSGNLRFGLTLGAERTRL